MRNSKRKLINVLYVIAEVVMIIGYVLCVIILLVGLWSIGESMIVALFCLQLGVTAGVLSTMLLLLPENSYKDDRAILLGKLRKDETELNKWSNETKKHYNHNVGNSFEKGHLS